MKLALLITIVFLSSCTQQKDYYQTNKKIKNVIFIIGDGMGPQQLSLLQLYAKHAPSSKFKGPTNLEKLMSIGETSSVMTNPGGKLVVDSSCSATQYATGEYSLPEVVGLDYKGRTSETILEVAKKAGLRTGLISDTRITHATPASYASHNKKRSNENEIAKQMLEVGPDLMLSGGLRHFLPSSPTPDSMNLIPKEFKHNSKRKDDENLLTFAKSKGYSLAFQKSDLMKNQSKKVLGLFSNSAMPNGIWYTKNKNNKDRTIPTLTEMTEFALKNLEKDNDKGFFLMVEAGQIDWAGHGNDAGLMLHELLSADEMLGVVYQWVKDRDDTLVVVTADHETGGFGFSYSAHDVLKEEKVSTDHFKDGIYKSYFNYGEYKILDKIYNQKSSFQEMLQNVSKWDKKEQTPQKMKEYFESQMDFKLSDADVAQILKSSENKYHNESHPYLAEKEFPHIEDFSAFYVYGNRIRQNIFARVLADQQNAVWATATHTSTPVMMVTVGPKSLTDTFDGLLHSTEVGRKTFKALGLSKEFRD
ncbi:alkaline phosphatase [Halobacteriovorax sp. HLS]|uniref:alkaline phosphatase n=1 Tax=Halobacteriovorax sp. HLS TaxID=2234000 RepID=UPI000FDC962D|nr:alkaline phosphatase [Halobacteriovorax sp. HLS]